MNTFVWPVYTRNEDNTYGATKNGLRYKPKLDHSMNAQKSRNKARWSIDEAKEYHVFKIGAESNYFCSVNNCYFSLVDQGNIIIGQDDSERLAKFPKVQNQADPYHGYPVRCRELWNIPSDSILDQMVEDEFITKTIRRRIERKKL